MHRKNILLGLFFAAAVAGVATLAIMFSGTPSPAPTEKPPLPATQPEPPTLSDQKFALPSWSLGILNDADIGWIELDSKISSMADEEKNNWRGWLPVAFENGSASDPWIGQIVLIAGLLRIKDETVVGRIQALCNALNASLALKASISLSLIQPHKSEGLLSPMFSDRSPKVRAEVCQASACLKEAWIERFLVRALEDENASVCGSAMDALLSYTSSLPEAEASIIKHARSSDPELRIPALRLIVAWKIENGYQLLHETASRGDRESRFATVMSLSLNADPRMRETLVILAEDRDDAIRAAAVKAVAQLDGATEHPDEQARR